MASLFLGVEPAGGVCMRDQEAQPSVRRMRLTDGLSRSSCEGGRSSPIGEWKSARWSSRSLPSYELPQLLRLSTGERPES